MAAQFLNIDRIRGLQDIRWSATSGATTTNRLGK